MDPLFAHITDFFNDHLDYWGSLGWNIIKIILLFILIKVGMSVLKRVIIRVLSMREKLDERRRSTLQSMLINLVRFVLYFVFVLTVLPIFGIQIGALLAGAGVAGVAIAFGAQSLLKDFFNGFFFLFEDQFGVGDFVVINDQLGEIYSVSLRVTEIQVWTGEIFIIPNGEITQVINYSKENGLALIEIEVGYHTEPEEAIEVMNEVMQSLPEEDDSIVGDVDVAGVNELNQSTYTVRATAEVKPLMQWSIQRLAKQRIREAFNQRGIDLPLQKIVYMRDESPQASQSSQS